jgi:TonB family protein
MKPVAAVEEALPCPRPCPDNPGDWLPAAAVSRRPDWIDGVIGEDDYPPDMRRSGKQGKVVVDVLIDATGAVKGVTLVEGSEPQFNELVLARLKISHFRPAYNGDGNAVSCKLRMPILFELR